MGGRSRRPVYSACRRLATDDRAHDALAALLPDARAGMINVFSAASAVDD
jgi:hypothetical protein